MATSRVTDYRQILSVVNKDDMMNKIVYLIYNIELISFVSCFDCNAVELYLCSCILVLNTLYIMY